MLKGNFEESGAKVRRTNNKKPFRSEVGNLSKLVDYQGVKGKIMEDEETAETLSCGGWGFGLFR